MVTGKNPLFYNIVIFIIKGLDKRLRKEPSLQKNSVRRKPIDF